MALTALLLGLAALATLSTSAANVTLAWDPSPTLGVAGYNIYYGTASGNYTTTVPAGSATTLTVSNLVSGTTYFFAATAYDDTGIESDYSSETNYTPSATGGNQTPTLNVVANMTINEDAAQQTVNLGGITSGSVSENQTLTVTASSSNTGLIPNPSVNYTSPNTTGSLNFTPAANASGSSIITVSVNDGGASNNIITRTFTVTVNAINDPPTLNTIANLTINEDAGQQTVSLAGISSGAANENQTLSVSATSSNPGLIPNPAITYSSPGASGTLTFTPVANGNGSANITVTVNDGGAQNNTFSRTFSVTVNAVNDAPLISAIGAQATTSDIATAPIAFTISDRETASGSLTLSGGSSNPTLVSAGGITFGGSGGNRTVTVTPNAGQIGTANITVTVSDGSLTASSTFSLTVDASRPANTPPVISAIGNQVSTQDTASPAIPFTVTDAESAASSLVLSGSSSNPTLVPNGNIAFGGSNSNRTVILTPATGQTGAVTITITVDDGTDTTNTSFLFTVSAGGAKTLAAANASYNGLFYETGQVSQASAGFFTLKTTSKGSYSGKVQVGGRYLAFHGTLGGKNGATNVIARKDGPPVTLDFHIGSGKQSDDITGQLTDGTWTSVLSGDRLVFNVKTNPAALAGNYTLVLPGQDGAGDAPKGDSYGIVRVKTSGFATFAGTLADGTKVSLSKPLSKHGMLPFYASLYAGQGSLLSWLAVTNAPDAVPDVAGLVSWIKNSGAKSKLYLSGFTTESYAIGSTYTQPGGPDIHVVKLDKANLTFSGGNLAADFTNSITLGSNSKVTNPGAAKFAMGFAASTGLFKGKVIDPGTGAPLSFSGAVLQKFNAGFGMVITADKTGRVLLDDAGADQQLQQQLHLYRINLGGFGL